MPSSTCGAGSPSARLEEEEVAVLVDVPAAEAEVPVDDPDRPVEHQLRQARSPPRSPAAAASAGVSPSSRCPLGKPQLS